MDLYHVLPEHVSAESVRLVGDESKHLIRVMRADVGERFLATNGLDEMFEVELESSSKEGAEGKIVRRLGRMHEPLRNVTLAVSLLRNPARFDFLVEKSVELGVRRIVPLQCERTIPKHEKHDRLQKLALAAMKQSQRSWLPPIESTSSFRLFVERTDPATFRFLLHEQTELARSLQSLLANLKPADSVILLIGPEGGFSDAEVRFAEEKGIQTASLGERRLRAETAAVAAVTMAILE